MFDQLGGSYQGQGVVDGSLVFSDKEIEIVMTTWAECTIGYNSKLNETNKYYQVHRQSIGQKLWENMSIDERKNEFFKSIRKDLEITTGILSDGLKVGYTEIVDYLIFRAYNPIDPISRVYKCLLVKLGATITEDGQLKIPAGLSERLENYLHNKQIMDLLPTQALDPKLKQNPNDFKLSLKSGL